MRSLPLYLSLLIILSLSACKTSEKSLVTDYLSGDKALQPDENTVRRTTTLSDLQLMSYVQLDEKLSTGAKAIYDLSVPNELRPELTEALKGDLVLLNENGETINLGEDASVQAIIKKGREAAEKRVAEFEAKAGRILGPGVGPPPPPCNITEIWIFDGLLQFFNDRPDYKVLFIQIKDAQGNIVGRSKEDIPIPGENFGSIHLLEAIGEGIKNTGPLNVSVLIENKLTGETENIRAIIDAKPK